MNREKGTSTEVDDLAATARRRRCACARACEEVERKKGFLRSAACQPPRSLSCLSRRPRRHPLSLQRCLCVRTLSLCNASPPRPCATFSTTAHPRPAGSTCGRRAIDLVEPPDDINHQKHFPFIPNRSRRRVGSTCGGRAIDLVSITRADRFSTKSSVDGGATAGVRSISDPSFISSRRAYGG